MNTAHNHYVRPADVFDKLRNRLVNVLECRGERALPVITLTYAQSIDGCIAPFEGGTLQLSNNQSQQLTHQIRALHDGILIGINTVLCDDPRLTVRLTSGSNPQPIILDSRLRFPMSARLLRDPCVRPIIATARNACRKKSDQLTAAGARVIRVPQLPDGLIDLTQLLPLLRQLEIRSVMVEGGSRVITSVLASHIADQLLLAIAPRFVGGLRAVKPTPAGEQMPELHDVHCQMLGGDLVVWGHLKPASGLSRTPSQPTRVSSDRSPEC